jgi:hypothetical protein
VLITVFGAMNTVIAGLVAYLKPRGQPMRARMYRDDMHRVVDEIENSEIMWLGISKGMHGYEADDEVTVRSEVARLTRLYDRAVKTNTMNNPDIYSAGAEGNLGITRARPPQPSPPPPPGPPQPPVPQPATATGSAPAPAPARAPDPDEKPGDKAHAAAAASCRSSQRRQERTLCKGQQIRHNTSRRCARTATTKRYSQGCRQSGPHGRAGS